MKPAYSREDGDPAISQAPFSPQSPQREDGPEMHGRSNDPETRSVRKPYIRPVRSTWWLKNRFYRFYMLREATALGAVAFSLLLLYGLYCLHSGPQAWKGFTALLAHPFMICVSGVVFLSALVHSKTWFELAPKALHLSAKGERRATQNLWAVTLAASGLLIAIFLGII